MKQVMENKSVEQNHNKKRPVRPVWSNTVRYIAIVCLIILVIFVLYMMRGSLMLVAISAVVAYLLNPVVRFFNKKLHIQWRIAIVIAYVLLILLLIAAFSFFIPWLTQKVMTFFAMDWPQVLAVVDDYINQIQEELDMTVLNIGGFNIDLSEPLKDLQESIHSFQAESIGIQRIIPDMMTAVRQVFSISTNVVGQLVTYFIMIVTAVMASIYMCRDGNKFGSVIINVFEEKYQPEIRELLHRLRLVWDRYFVGELKLMLWIGLISFLVYWAMGMRWPFFLGVIAGFLEVVPNIGPIIATVPAIISALIFGSTWIPFNNIVIALLVVVVSVIIQQTENLFLVPHIMGNALELHPLIIIIGIMMLSSQMGAVGAVAAAPLIGLSKEILYFIINKIKRQDPYPELYRE